MIAIRPAEAADQDTIRSMITAEELDPTSMDWRHFLVAQDESVTPPRIVGIGQIRQLPGAQELGSLIVLEDYRGQGIAGNLIRALAGRAGRPLYLLCETKMASYYARFGFKRLSFWRAPWVLKFKLLIPTVWYLFRYQFMLMWKQQA